MQYCINSRRPLSHQEGYVLINAHPGFAESVSVTGMINEPPAAQMPTTKMIQVCPKLMIPREM